MIQIEIFLLGMPLLGAQLPCCNEAWTNPAGERKRLLIKGLKDKTSCRERKHMKEHQGTPAQPIAEFRHKSDKSGVVYSEEIEN